MRRDILCALERLLQNAPYKEIGVIDICAEVHVSKPTFYRYFQGKDFIVHWLSKELFDSGVAQVGRKYTWLEGLTLTIMGFYEHRRLYAKISNQAFNSSLISNSALYLKTALVETLIDYKEVKLTEKCVYQIDALNYALGYVTKQWIEEGARVPPKRMAEYLASSVPQDLFLLLNEPMEREQRDSM